jgi:hypothetical protein
MARITALLACVLLQCHLAVSVPVRVGQDVDAVLAEIPALNPSLVNEVNADENMTWLVNMIIEAIYAMLNSFDEQSNTRLFL